MQSRLLSHPTQRICVRFLLGLAAGVLFTVLPALPASASSVATTVTQYINDALQALGAANVSAAQQAALKAVEADPKSAEAEYTLGLVYQTAGRLAEAEQAYWQAVQQDPTSTRYHFALGSSYAESNKDNLAVAEFELVLQSDPNNAAAHYQLGQILASQDNEFEAVKHWDAAIALQPDYAPAMEDLGLYYYNAKQPDQAIDLWVRAAKLDQRNVDLLWRLANAFAERKHDDQDIFDSVWYFRRFRTLAPPATDASLLQHADRVLAEYGDKAAQYFDNLGIVNVKNSAKAIECFNRAIDLRPDFAGAYYNLALSLQEAGKFDEAVKMYEQTIRFIPDYAPAYANLGLTYMAEKQPFQAEEALRKAHDLAPDDKNIGVNLAVALWQGGAVEDARGELTALTSKHPDFASAWYNLACLEASQAQIKNALAALKAAVGLEGRYRQAAVSDPDLASLRGEAEFVALTSVSN